MIDTLEPTPGRLEPVRLENGAYLLQDDYKASLETVHTALDVLESIDCRRKLIIMGEVSEPPGSQGPVYRALGERMGRIADKIVLVGGNFQRYAAGAVAVGFPRDAIVDAGRDFRRASDAIADDLAAGDVVLIKGRETQSLDRIALLLQGHSIRCEIDYCEARLRCARCPMLESGWGHHRVIT